VVLALIRLFEGRPLTPARVHDDVVCGYAAVEVGGQRILQLETYGSDDRKIPGKVSQSLQLDEDGARELKAILERSFPGL
jgi:hypothetical protein